MKTFLLSLVVVACAGCSLFEEKGERVEGTGKMSTILPSVRSFEKIQLDTGGQVLVKPGKSTKVSIETDSNLLPYINTDVVGGVLKISSKVPIDPTQFKVNIVTPKCSGLTVNAASETSILGLSGKTFDLEVNGSGSIDLTGEVDSATYKVIGAASVKADQLKAKVVNAEINGAGSMSVRASESLSATIDGAGNIVYAGQPKDVKRSINGVGAVKPK